MHNNYASLLPKHPKQILDMISFISRWVDDNDMYHDLTGDPMNEAQKQKYKDDLQNKTETEINTVYLWTLHKYKNGLDFYKSKNREQKARFRIVKKPMKDFKLQKKVLFFWLTVHKSYEKYGCENIMFARLQKPEEYLYDRYGNNL
jgi:hypothetical protein